MTEIIKVALIGIIGVLTANWFKANKAEYSGLFIVGIGFMIFGFAFRQVALFLEQFAGITTLLGENAGYLNSLLKVVGITYICEFAASLCKDSGCQTMAGQIEILGKLSVVMAGLPILLAVIEQIQGLIR